MNILEIKNITKTYEKGAEKILALDRFSLKMKPKDFVVVQGESGCGKTTLLLICGGLLCPDSGSVKLGGEEIYSLPAEKRAALRAAKVGFVFQQFNLIPYLTVQENIISASLSSAHKPGKERAAELIKYLGLLKRAGHYPSELSTGERQRTALARAVFNKPELIFADEPTGNLDEKNAEKTVAFLKEFAGLGGAVIFVTHSRRIIRESRKVIRLTPVTAA
ncbi:MAG: ABC transporter ATP-binding protein [Candidatus Firestonebacteria bacterium]